MSATLIALATQIGVPLIEKILTKRLGAGRAQLATDIVRVIADRAGTTPSDLEILAASDPGIVIEALHEVERMAPEMVALHAAEVEGQFALLQREMDKPVWTWAWRPAAMYGFGVLWFWNIVIIHIANAYWKIALPQSDLAMLFQLNALYIALYMGGHTVKDFVSARWGKVAK